MAVLVVLIVSALALRLAGFLGATYFATWQSSIRYAVAIMFVFTGVAHFTKLRHEMAAMIPSAIPAPMAMVYFTGLCEIAGAIGLLIPRTRTLAGICLIVFLIAVFPANAKAAREHLPVAGKPATPLAIRVPLQIVFMGLVWWVSRA
jgi:uncharacterized membrane protein